MDAIQKLILDLEASKISSNQQPVVVPIDDFIAALNEIEGAIGPGAVSSVTNTDGALNITPSTGAVVVNIIASAIATAIGIFTSLLNGLVPASGGGTANFLRADGTWNVPPGTGGVTFANPTATAGPAAVNGVATTAMRSDAAPAVQTATSAQLGLVQPDGTIITVSAGAITVPKASSSVFGVVEVDGSTITSSSGVLSGSEGLISRQTPSGTGTVTFSSIPGTFRDLKIVIDGASSAAAVSEAVNIEFNGDSGSNYDIQFIQGTGSSATSGGTVATTPPEVCQVTGASVSNVSSGGIAYIPNYAQTTFQKWCLSKAILKTGTASTSNFFIQDFNIWWRNTAAITSITLTLASGNWVAGSTVSLYGVK